MSIEANKKNSERFTKEVINGKNLSAVDELVASNYVYHGTGSEERRGRESIKQYCGMLHKAFPDLKMTMEDTIAEGDTVVNRFTVRGTNTGELMGIPPTGKHITIPAIVISHFREGKQVEVWEVDDMFSMLQQMAVIPALGQPAARH